MKHLIAEEDKLNLHPWGVSSLVMEPPAGYGKQGAACPETNTDRAGSAAIDADLPDIDADLPDVDADHAGIDIDEAEKRKYYPSRSDLLWKGIQESLVDDFLWFFFPEIAARLDLDRGVEYLDKEMAQLFPPENEQFEPRRVDKLIKVFTRQGDEECILLHTEVQGYYQKTFSKRMFRYYCRIWDKYQIHVKALAVLIDGDKSFRPAAYQESDAFDEDCRLYYGFKVYKVMDQSEEELKKSDNPFAIVILAAKALLERKSGKLSEEDLLQLKLDLVRRVEQKKLPEAKRQAGFSYVLPAL